MAAEETNALDKKQHAEASEINRIRKEFEDGYPTHETIAEFLEADRSGGKDTIKALLEKRRALRLKTEDPTQPANLLASPKCDDATN